jgi:ribosomal protein S12 methylthiotransferase
LVAKGVKEIMLIAQDLTYYGIDLYKENRFNNLLTSLSDIRGLEWIRLHYAYPACFPVVILDVMAKRPNICNYIDMPIQHINNRILSLMQRGHTREGTINLLEKIREKLPEAALRTTLIVGFPGETEKEFEELVDFVHQFRFHRLGVFAYSHEEGTTAFKLQDNVPAIVKQKRLEKLMSVQESVSLKHNENMVGKTMKVLVDSTEGDYFIGRTEYDSPEVDNEVLIQAPEMDIILGRFYPVKIYKADCFDLYGTISQF